MTLAKVIVQQIERLPEPLQQEVIDFVEFLQSKHHIAPDQSSWPRRRRCTISD